MPDVTVQLRDAFGVGREVPQNYVERTTVDGTFVGSLTRDKHVVIFGSSKQGKTTLRKHCLNESDYILVSCLNTMSLADLNGAILKSAGFRVEQTLTKTVGGSWKFNATFKGEGKVPFLASASAEGGGELERTSERVTTYATLEIDLNDVNDVIISLKSIDFTKFIILEDFHYLPIETQQNFSFALKSFHENSSLCFIVVGVWREENRLIYYNGDLTGRVVSIDVDKWSSDDLKRVIEAGEALLNIKFSDNIKDEIASSCFDSVSLVQEVCFKICEQNGITHTLDDIRYIESGVDVSDLVKSSVNEQAGRYSAFINNFSEGFQQTELEMYKWLIYTIIISDVVDLETGLRRAKVSSLIKAKHPNGAGLNEGNVTQALQNAASLQVQRSIRPIIIDYDQTTRVLSVVDKSFLIWLAQQNRKELLSEIDITVD